MICPKCEKENRNEYATVCAYCGQNLYHNADMDEKAKELAAKRKSDKANSIIKTLLAIILAIVVVIVAIIIPKPSKPTDEATLPNSNDISNEPITDANGNPVVLDGTIPDTPEEILFYFNQNANRVKTEAIKVVKNYEDREIKKIEAPKIVQSTAEGMVKTFMADDTEPVEYTTREEIVENFQVPRQKYVSSLTMNDIEEATCEDKGTYYEIKIRVKSEDNPSAGRGVGAAFDVIEPEEVEGKSDMVEDFSTQYTDCTIVAKFDKETDRMISANYMIPTKLMLTVNFMGTHKITLDMSFEKDYTITY